jgi:hypothetical protein
MDVKEAQNRERRAAAKRAFEVIELARQLGLSAEVAEALYERSGENLVRSIARAKEEGLVSASLDLPAISTVGRGQSD